MYVDWSEALCLVYTDIGDGDFEGENCLDSHDLYNTSRVYKFQ